MGNRLELKKNRFRRYGVTGFRSYSIDEYYGNLGENNVKAIAYEPKLEMFTANKCTCFI